VTIHGGIVLVGRDWLDEAERLWLSGDLSGAAAAQATFERELSADHWTLLDRLVSSKDML
jgi:hypothetical protein